jgi:hypothetical protein
MRAPRPRAWELLVVAEISAARGGEVRLARLGDDGPLLKLRAPPYGFGDEA